MTPELIKQWAEQAGLHVGFPPAGRHLGTYVLRDDLAKFAALVAAHQRELDARICDAQAKEPECPERAQYCAAAIRGRSEGEKKPPKL